MIELVKSVGARWPRLGVGIACFLASAFITVEAVRSALEKTGVEQGQVGLALGLNAAFPLAVMARPQFFGQVRVGFLGDSTVIGYPKGNAVHDRLQEVLQKRAKGRFRVQVLGAPGFSSFEYYALSEAIARAHPEHLVIPFNLGSFSRGWRGKWDRLEVTGWLSPRQLPQALSLPLYSWGLTLDRLISYVAIVQLGLAQRWYDYRRLQVRVDRGIQELRQWFQLRAGLRAGSEPPIAFDLVPGMPNRFNARRLQSIYGDALAGVDPRHPVLLLLRTALATFRRAGIKVLVYVVPVNVEHLERVGLDSRECLALTTRRLGRIVEAEGAQFLDLHDLLPDEGFRDPAGHFAYDGKIDGPMLVARELAAALLGRKAAAGGPAGGSR